MLDGIAGGQTGVMLLKDGRILGGDAFFYYLGAYSSANGRWKGEFVNQEHTPAKDEHPLFGGYEVGIGFSGRCDAEGAEIEATALAGKLSIRFAATLKLIQPFAGWTVTAALRSALMRAVTAGRCWRQPPDDRCSLHPALYRWLQ